MIFNRIASFLRPCLLAVLLVGAIGQPQFHVSAAATNVNTITIPSTPAGGAGTGYAAGEVITVRVNFTAAETVTGTPTIVINVGGNLRTAKYASGSGTANLDFTYTVVAGDADANGISVAANSLALSGGSINNGTDAAQITHVVLADQATDIIAASVAALDTTAPVLRSALGAGSSITLFYDELGSGLRSTPLPPIGNFTFSRNGGVGGQLTVTSVLINHTANTVTLGLNGLINLSDTNMRVGYTANGTNDIQDVIGNKIANFSNVFVANTMPAFDVKGNMLAFDTPTSLAGNGQTAGNQVLFSNVITIDGQTIDAIVTTTALTAGTTIVGFDTLSGTVAPALSTTPAAVDLQWFKLNTNIGAGGGDITVTFDFIKGGSYNAANLTASKGDDVILQNVAINSYDLDGAAGGATQFQYQEFGGYATYTVANNSALTQSQVGTLTHFQTTTGGNVTNSPGTDAGDQIRVMALYEAIHEFQLKTGAIATGGAAYYYLDFSKGPNWFNPIYTYEIPTVNPKVTNDTTPDLTGTFVGCALTSGTPSATVQAYTLRVVVNGKTYTAGETAAERTGTNPIVLLDATSGLRGEFNPTTCVGTWTLTIPPADALPLATYDVSVDIGYGTSLATINKHTWDNTTNELVINGTPPDTTAPTFTSITRGNPTGQNLTSTSLAIQNYVDFTVTFSEAVTNVDVTDFQITGAGSTGSNISSVTQTGPSTFTVRVSNIPTTNTGVLDLNLVGTTDVVDLAGNLLAKGTLGTEGVDPTSGIDETYIISNATISDFVWNDLDGDGVQDGGLEVGLNNVRVYIDSNGNNTYDVGEVTATTNASGLYSITGLAPGTYDVRIDTTTLPAGYSGTFDLDGIASLNEASVTVTAGQTRTDVDFGYQQTATIGDFIWNDINGDGIQDPNGIDNILGNGDDEIGINSVTVRLLDSTGATVLQTTTTAGGGLYSFTTAPGTYIVEFVTPAGYTRAPIDQGGNDTLDSDASIATGRTAAITVVGGATNTTVDAGFYLLGSVTGSVLRDTDNNNTGDAAFAGVTLSLYTDPNGDGNPADGALVTFDVDSVTAGTQSSVLSQADGSYTLSNVPPGTYVVVETQPAGYQTVSQSDTTADTPVAPADAATTADRIPVNLAISETDSGNTFIEEQLGSITGFVLRDTDNNDIGDAAFAGLTLSLYTDPNNDGNPADGALVTFDVDSVTAGTQSSVVSQADGSYTLSNVPPGTYVVVETQPAGYQTVNQSDTTADTPVAPADAATSADRIPVNLATGETDSGNTFVEEQQGSITGSVLRDTDDNNTGDAPFAGVTLTLYSDANANGIVDGADAPVTFDVDSGTAGIQSAVVSAADGSYTLANVPPGTYIIVETQPAGYQTVNQSDTTADTPVAPSDAATSADRIPVNLATGETDSGNTFIEEQLGSITGSVLRDTDNNDTGDAAFVGVTLTLYSDANANGIVDGADAPVTFDVDPGTAGTQSSIVSIAGGAYTLSNVPPGSYIVVETQPAGYQTVGQSDTTADTPVAPADAATGADHIPVNLATGETDSGNTFVEEQLGSITGSVLRDTDNNDTGDALFAGVTLSLYTDPNNDGNPADGALVTFDVDSITAGTQSSVVSQADGTYTLSNVPPGSYVVVETQPAGYQTVSQSDTTADTPVAPADAATTADRIPVNLSAGETDSGNTFIEEQPGSITGLVQKDTDHNGTGDVVFAGVTLALWTDPNNDGNPADGALVSFDVDPVTAGTQSSVVSAADGSYTFANVPAGSYVVVETQPAGHQTVSQSDTTADVPVAPADAAPAADRIPVNLSTGETDSGNTFIEEQYATISGLVQRDTDNNNSGDAVFAGVTLSLWTDPNNDGNPADGALVSFDVDPGTAGIQSSVISAADGSFTFANVPPGVSYVVVETQPAGYQTVSQSDTTADTPAAPADAAPAADRIPVTPVAGETDSGNTFIEEQLGSITGLVQRDTDNNNSGDAVFAGVTLALWTDPNNDGNPADGALVIFDVDPVTAGTQSSVVSAADGSYTFANVPPGSYVVVETQPAGYQTVSQSDTTADVPAAPADAATAADRIPVNLTTGETDSGNTFIEEQLGSISGLVLIDIDDNGTGDAIFAGVTLTLYNDVNADGLVNGADAVVTFDIDPGIGGTQSSVSSAAGTGAYTFANVPPGSYIVVETQPAGYVTVSQSDTTVDVPAAPADAAITVNNIPVNLATGEIDSGNTFIEEQVSSIGDKVWTDSDGSGTLNGAEVGINGVILTLYRDNNNDGLIDIGDTNLGTQTTAGNGDYNFTNLPAGNYLVDVPTVAGNSLTTANDPHDVTLVAGVNYTTADFGFRPVSNIGDKVWTDSDGSGTLNGAEVGINGVILTLYRDNNNDGLIDIGDTNLGTQTTVGNGDYNFTNLPAGNYLVDVPTVAGNTLTTANDPHDVTLVAGVNYTTADFGFRPVFSITGQVRNDADNDGSLADADSGLANAQVSLWTDPNGDGNPADGVQVGATVTTTATGTYSFNNVVPGNYVVVEVNPAGYTSTADSAAPNNDRVPVVITNANSTGNDFLDVLLLTISGQVRNDVDNDGSLADADSGLANAQVSLWTDPNGDGNPADGVQVGATVTTTATGTYSFNNVVPGNYVVVEVNPAGYTSTADSAAPNNDRVPVVLTTTNSTGNDFLDVLLLTINGQVRNDVDNDGDLGDADSGLAGATITLYLDPDGDGDPTTGGATVVGVPLTTTGTGNYTFSNLLPGNYVIVETNPVGYNSTADSAGPNNDRIPVTLTNANSTGNVFLDWINAQVRIVKTPSLTVITSGGAVTYSYVVTNPGAVSVTSVVVSDDKCTPVTYVSGDTNTNNTLETTETWNYTCTTTLSATTTNIATVTASDPLNNTIQDTDTVTVTVVSSGLSKTIVGTDTGVLPDFTSGNDVAIGEIVTYEISIDLPAGLAFTNVVVTDRMEKGLAFVDCLLVDVAGANVTGTVCPPVISSITDPGDVATNPANLGRQVQFNIGNITAPAAASKLTIRYRAIVLDVIENQSAVQLNNNVTWTWNGGSLTTSAPDVNIIEPDLSIDKSATPSSNVAIGTPIQFTLTINHTSPQSTADAFDVVVTDILPPTLEYIPCSITYSGWAPTNPVAPAYCGGPTSTLTFTWDTFPRGQIAVINFSARLVGTPAINSASVAWTSLPIDPGAGGLPQQLSVHNPNSTERWYDPTDTVNIYAVTDSATINGITPPSASPSTTEEKLPVVLPATGFAPNIVTILPEQSSDKAYTTTDVWLEIPSQGINMPIVGVPLFNGDWDLSWLSQEVGWLNGTAFPGWEGNSGLTGHVTLPNGKPGPFANLGSLKWGDKIIVHANGEVYTYEVRENRTIKPYNTSVLNHEEDAWLTLITCKTYIESTNTYANRIAVRAVLVKVQTESSSSTDRR